MAGTDIVNSEVVRRSIPVEAAGSAEERAEACKTRALLAASVHTAVADWLAAPVDKIDHSSASRKLAAAAAASTMIDTARALDSCSPAVAAEVHNSVAIDIVAAETEEACMSYRN